MWQQYQMCQQELRVNELNVKIKDHSESCLSNQFVVWLSLKPLYSLRDNSRASLGGLTAEETCYSVNQLPACFQNICFSYKKVYTAGGTLFSRKLNCSILILFPFLLFLISYIAFFMTLYGCIKTLKIFSIRKGINILKWEKKHCLLCRARHICSRLILIAYCW